MEQLDKIINQILNNFDFAYMLTVNVLTYILIKVEDYRNKRRKVSTIVKRLFLLISIIIVTIVYLIFNYSNNIVLVNSAILSPIFWSWVLKPIFIKFGIGYKQIDDFLK